MILCGGVYNPYHICNENTFKNMYLPLGFLTLSLGVFHKYLLNEYWVMDLHRMKKHVENPWEKSAKPKTEEIWLMTTSVLDSQLCVTLKLSDPQNFLLLKQEERRRAQPLKNDLAWGHNINWLESNIPRWQTCTDMRFQP